MIHKYQRLRHRDYMRAGITLELVNDLAREYALALASGDERRTATFAARLADIDTKRQEIKQRIPKPE